MPEYSAGAKASSEPQYAAYAGNNAITPQQPQRIDVGALYSRMYDGTDATADELRAIKQHGIELGHSGVLYRACELLGEGPTNRDVAVALHNAIGTRGWDIRDEQQAVGSLYQRLFGRDFDTMVFYVDGSDGVFPTAYLGTEGMAQRILDAKLYGKPPVFAQLPVQKVLAVDKGCIEARYAFGDVAVALSPDRREVNVIYRDRQGMLEQVKVRDGTQPVDASAGRARNSGFFEFYPVNSVPQKILARQHEIDPLVRYLHSQPTEMQSRAEAAAKRMREERAQTETEKKQKSAV